MLPQDLKTYSRIGKALISDSSQGHVVTEIFSAVMLLNLSEEHSLERATSQLLKKSIREHSPNSIFKEAENAQQLGWLVSESFFRLTPTQRFLLIAVHQGQWSYQRISNITGMSIEEIEAKLWAARINFVFGRSPGQQEKTVTYPAGPAQLGYHCPKFDSSQPWTQRFLDQELASGQDRVFLQNHLLNCRVCSDVLARSRKFYYAVDRQLDEVFDEIEGNAPDEELIRLKYAEKNSPFIGGHSERSFLESLKVFFARKEIQWASGIGVVLLVIAFLMK